MVEMRHNPFRYGNAISPDLFIGRCHEIRTIFNRIKNGESTGIYGGPHIGKSSVLRYIADERQRSDYLEALAQRCIFINIDCQEIPVTYRPQDIWQRVWQHAQQACTDARVQERLASRQQAGPHAFELRFLVNCLADFQWRLVLIFEEIHMLLSYPLLNGPEFLGVLRALCVANSLVLVVSSRPSIAEVNERLYAMHGSRLLNHLREVRLTSFQSAEVAKLLENYLRGTSINFSPTDQTDLRRISGRHPYLFQAAAAELLDTINQNIAGPERYHKVLSQLQHSVAGHFLDQWKYLNEQEQMALLVVVLGEMPRLARRPSPALEAFKKDNPYRQTLVQLAQVGLVIQDGDEWRISADSFAYWIAINILGNSEQPLNFEQWVSRLQANGKVKVDERKRWHVLQGRITPDFSAHLGAFVGELLKRLGSP